VNPGGWRIEPPDDYYSKWALKSGYYLEKAFDTEEQAKEALAKKIEEIHTEEKSWGVGTGPVGSSAWPIFPRTRRCLM
jgi:hypothetical protein